MISTIRWYIDKLDEKMLDDEDSLPEFVRKSENYKKKKEEYIQQFVDHKFEMSSSQDIATCLSQLPKWVQNHKYVNQKLNHRTKEELSSFRILKNLNETCKELKNNPSQKAFEQRVMIVASVICPRYGVPQIHETQEVIEAAWKLKKRICNRKSNKPEH